MESGSGFDIENPYISLANSMRTELNSLPRISSKCTIYRVPDRLRLVNEKAYTPQVVAIGPFHHGKDSLKAMEVHKMRYLRKYLERTGESLENYMDIVKESEATLRDFYAETIEFSSDEFVKLILIDSAFIIEVLLRFSIREFQDKNDRIFCKPWMLQDISPDLRLLENQLPFFILEKLYKPHKITLPSGYTENFSIIKLSHNFFTSLLHLEGTQETLEEIEGGNVAHFIDFLRKLCIPLNPRNGQKCESVTAPSITELHCAGVKFKVASSKNLFDVNFNNGILEIPKLTISDDIELIILNLLAFEQCHYDEYYLNDYVITMNRLVNISKDVDLLVKHGIVENMVLDSGEAATLIKNLADAAIFDRKKFYFADIFENLNAYYRPSWHKWKANLKQKYFKTPSAIVLYMAVILLNILGIIQAVCSILQVRWR